MLQTVRDACQFDPKAIDYALSDQIESLDDLVGHDPAAAEAFFKQDLRHRRHADPLAAGTPAARRRLRPGGLRTQAGDGRRQDPLDARARLSRRESRPAHLVPKEITAGFKPAQARVVAISGRSISRDKHLWGDIAEQLGKADKFLEFYKGAPKAPNEKDWVDLIGDEPTLILLDELPPYFGYGVTQPVGGGTLADVTDYAVSNLLSAALKLKRLCVVISNLSGSYRGRHQANLGLDPEGGRQPPAGDRPPGQEHHAGRTRLRRNLPHPAHAPACRRARGEGRRLRRDRVLRSHFGRGEVEDRREIGRADRRRDRRVLSVPPVVQAHPRAVQGQRAASGRPAA